MKGGGGKQGKKKHIIIMCECEGRGNTLFKLSLAPRPHPASTLLPV